ncbi:MAG TPA: response regulator, partial [Longimicrobium sp.]|nr:response regulator [Longimicrobium sp.]
MPERTVLLIDDNEDVVRIVTELLTHAGYEPIPAGSAAEGVRPLRERRPDVVVVEPYTFGPSRWNWIASLTAGLQAHPPPPFLAVSTLAGEKTRARMVGCAGFLPKPVAPGVVLRGI